MPERSQLLRFTPAQPQRAAVLCSSCQGWTSGYVFNTVGHDSVVIKVTVINNKVVSFMSVMYTVHTKILHIRSNGLFNYTL